MPSEIFNVSSWSLIQTFADYYHLSRSGWQRYSDLQDPSWEYCIWSFPNNSAPLFVVSMIFSFPIFELSVLLFLPYPQCRLMWLLCMKLSHANYKRDQMVIWMSLTGLIVLGRLAWGGMTYIPPILNKMSMNICTLCTFDHDFVGLLRPRSTIVIFDDFYVAHTNLYIPYHPWLSPILVDLDTWENHILCHNFIGLSKVHSSNLMLR